MQVVEEDVYRIYYELPDCAPSVRVREFPALSGGVHDSVRIREFPALSGAVDTDRANGEAMTGRGSAGEVPAGADDNNPQQRRHVRDR